MPTTLDPKPDISKPYETAALAELQHAVEELQRITDENRLNLARVLQYLGLEEETL